jgi:hypothetical protein
MSNSHAVSQRLSRLAGIRPCLTMLGLVATVTLAPGLSGGTSGAATRANQLTFHPQSVNPPAAMSLYGVSCSSATWCIAVGEAGTAIGWHDGQWTSPVPLNSGGSVSTVSCPTSQFCVAISDGGQAITYSGDSWSTPVRIGPAATYKVSCTSATFCAAVGASGMPEGPRTIATLRGGTWTSRGSSSSKDVNNRLLGVSCVSPEFCIAVDLNGEILKYTGAKWSATLPRGPRGLISVACASVSTCMAVTSSGLALLLHGAHWSKPHAILGFSHSFAYSVSCVSTDQCSVLGLNGQAVLWDKGQWSRPHTVIPGGAAATVTLSCVRPNFCLAVNSRGDAATY